ncbi:pyrimidine-nucleoside phosphorylase [Paenibacillus alginolyticus]|uniref:Pyrimidine-nucleoside phosphorylase n=1 Tax=Paenibacillus alginolyticus TaxID=59839 RepID=A0ABT4GAM0_9BACL|nr:pyrimidine-nucleoside phosphorylase [Paenibacillus alginolyticus]MCY9693199.1 pyrimidine-nucleoside phosphorylase [Paenibacillus alginolyticus]MEC0144506.1 pyrimidine-nucleoside phosphorylase [Paenibacillus alginolyticus]
MRMVDLIEKKRDGKELTTREIYYIIEGYTKDEIPDYQVSALAMAIYFQDMTERERADLTMAMVHSGDMIDLSAIAGVKVDKHSTGGVGDTTTLVLAPLVAALDIPVAKMSGRGLGHTGGTIDKLESIAGFHSEIGKDEFVNLVNKDKISIVGQSGNLTPADKKLYALRDVTATVNSIPLIASSIMSKKIAAGSDAIVLDVKMGAGAFMKTLEDAQELAYAMVRIGNNVGRKTMAVISDMSQPLGNAIGNALEVKEAIDTLQGIGPKDLEELCYALGRQMVYLANKASSLEEAEDMLKEVIRNGKALNKFKEFILNQGGDPSVVDHPEKLPQAEYRIEVLAREDGVVAEIVADEIGTAAMLLGAGRVTKESTIDLAVGLMLNKKIGDSVKVGESLVTIHSNRENVSEVIDKIYANIRIANQAEPPLLVYGTVVE